MAVMRNLGGIGTALFLMAPVLSMAANAPTGAECKADLRRIMSSLTVDTLLQNNAPILQLDPEKLCQANKNASLNKRPGANSMQEALVCQNAFIRTKAAVQEYETAMTDACRKIDEVQSCPPGENRTSCMAGRAREAAAASQRASDSLRDAKKEIDKLQEAATHARDTFKSDLPKIQAALKKIDEQIAAAKARGAMDEAAQLQTKRDTATTIGPNGELSVGGGILAVLDENQVSSNRGIEGNRSTISAYGNLIPRQGNRVAGLEYEQDTAVRTMDRFNATLGPEIQRRAEVAAGLNSYASTLTGLARNETESITKNPVSAASTLSGKTNPLNSLAAAGPLMQAGAGLSNAMGAQAASNSAGMGSIAQAPASSAWQNVAGAVQNLTGLNQGSDSSKLAGPNPAPGKGLSPDASDKVDPKNSESNVAFHPGSLRGAGSDESFVSGNGDLPLESATAASRALASDAKNKLGEGRADAKTYGKKKKGESNNDEKIPCPPGQDCAAAAAASGSQFQKGGSLGVPVLGAPDPALNAAGALDNLFGPLPGLDAAGNPTSPTAMKDGGSSWGLEGEIGGLSEGESGAGKQGAEEVAPANSRSLFARVRVVHERALKKGAVSLFHKKL